MALTNTFERVIRSHDERAEAFRSYFDGVFPDAETIPFALYVEGEKNPLRISTIRVIFPEPVRPCAMEDSNPLAEIPSDKRNAIIARLAENMGIPDALRNEIDSITELSKISIGIYNDHGPYGTIEEIRIRSAPDINLGNYVTNLPDLRTQLQRRMDALRAAQQEKAHAAATQEGGPG